MISIELLLESNLIKKTYGKFNKKFFNICVDSRVISEGDIFLAIKGSNFNGFDFIPELIKKGYKEFVIEYSDNNVLKINKLLKAYSGLYFICVTNTIDYLQEVSKLRIVQWKKLGGKIIAITGSNGKTTTKEILFSLLKKVYPKEVVATKKNLNNHIGVPLSILQLNDSCRFLIIEMGSNHFGEISNLCKICMPDYGIITNIGLAHIEFFKNCDGVFKEKSELYNYIKKNSTTPVLVINSGDNYLKKLKGKIGVIAFSEKKLKTSNGLITFYSSDKEISFKNNNIIMYHNILNLISGYLLAINLFPEKKKDLEKAVELISIDLSNRGEWINIKNKKIFLDAYNANPSSMNISIEEFIRIMDSNKYSLQDCLFILGDMNELGSLSADYHYNLGKKLSQLGVINVVFVGKYSHNYSKGFCESSSMYSSTYDLIKVWKKYEKYSYFFIKGSRSLQLESIVRSFS